MISEQTLVFQSNFSVQTPPKLYDPLSKRFGTYGIDFVKHGTISAKFIDSVRLNIARKLKRQHGFGYGYVPIHLLLRVVLKLVWAGEGAIAFGRNKVKLVKLLNLQS
jgi:hypothetical protein